MVSLERIYDLQPESEINDSPRLLVPWHSRREVFLGNLRDLFFPRSQPRLLVTSAPGIFWKDVFVHRPIPLRFIFDSYALHILVVLTVYFVFSSSLFFPQHLPARDPYANATIEYYSVSEYLPSIASTPKSARQAFQGKPAFAKQEIISVPPEPDNSRQTIVTPDLKVLSKDVPLPNMMVWGDRPDPIQPLSATANLNQHPKLITPADIIAPPPEDLPRVRSDLRFTQTAIIKPAPEDVPNSRRKLPLFETDVVKPAPELPAGARSRVISPLEPSVIAPPPTPDGLRRPAGAMNVGKLAPTVTEPKLPVQEQRPTIGQAGGAGGTASGSAQPNPAVPPPPSLQSVGGGRGSGQLIALSAEPAPVLGPIEIPRGSRRGVFAAGPNGTLGAPGTPDIAPAATDNGAADKAGTGPSSAGGSNHLPEGVYVGPGPSAPPTGAVVVASPAPPKPEPSFKDKLLGAMRNAMGDVPHPSVTANTPPLPKSETKIEDKVFGDKKYYSMILNMPNLNSSAGSWIIRFAELTPTKAPGDLSAPVALNKVDPAYPAELIRDKVEGTVFLYAVIRADGNVDSIRVLQSLDGRLDQSAMKALQKWHFRPGTKQGAAVDVEAVVQIPFRVTKLKW